ncbi:MAG: MotA/TolQ/ExbB proton channel family protein [Holophagales bacterium]|jgi:biopolymer transport protein TolQ|nr:MotA/TolQ/ExbB proton channel family protein [Holophagales bacterium]
MYFGLLQGLNLKDVVINGGSVAKVVLVILLFFSIFSWVVILQKVFLFRRSRRASEKFRVAFRKATDWREFKQNGAKYNLSPLQGLFLAGYSEVTYQLRLSPPGSKSHIRNMEAVERSLQRASVVEMGRMEKHMGVLATVAAVSPFIGLFGTVWGIIEAFQRIGAMGNANLVTVAVPIAEALVATALGLVAAVPALMAYNFFQSQLKQWQTSLDDYSLEFVSLSERNFTESK